MITAVDLPLELVLRILSFFAALDISAATRLTYVSSWARKLALPYIYRYVVIHNPKTLSAGPIRLHGYSRLKHLEARLPLDARPLVRGVWCALDREKVGAAYCGRLFELLRQSERIALKVDVFRDFVASLSNAPRDFLTPCTDLTLLSNTLRYDWDRLLSFTSYGPAFLGGLTHLTLSNMAQSRYLPFESLQAITHIAITIERRDFPHVESHRAMIGMLMREHEHAKSLQDVVVVFRAPLTFLSLPSRLEWLRKVMAWQGYKSADEMQARRSVGSTEPSRLQTLSMLTRELKFVIVEDDDKAAGRLWRSGGEVGPSLWELAVSWDDWLDNNNNTG